MSARGSAAPFGLRAMANVFDDGAGDLRAKVTTIYALLGTAVIGAWVLAWAAFAGRPALLGTALLAFTFGLRHAVDADHISAIDNVTRKLMQQGKRPVAVGFFFSLGHSTIVVALTLAIALASVAVKRWLPGLESAGGIIGTVVSAGFLYAIAALNLVVFLDVLAAFRRMRRNGECDAATADALPAAGGLLSRLFAPLTRMVSNSRHMYPIGVLFGLGFDTATEVGLLGIAAIEGGKGLPIADILIFPLLFTVGMSLLDTTDGILMLGAYGWAYVKPMRKLYYNLNITLLSVLVAVAVGTIEVIGIVSSQLSLHGPFWDTIANLDFGKLGFGIVGLFVVAWAVSAGIYKAGRYDDLDTRRAATTAAEA